MEENLENNGNNVPGNGAVQYKRRKVSAVRTFPEGCGRNAVKITLKYLESVSADEELKISRPDSVDIDEGSANKIVGFSGELEEGEIQDSDEDIMNEGEFQGSVKDEDIDELVSLLEKEIGCGEIVSPMKEELEEEYVLDLKKELNEVNFQSEQSCGETVSPMNEELEEEYVLDLKKELYEVNFQSERSCGENVSGDAGVKKFYLPKRVLATRKFPEFCGRNAPQPTEEDRLRILGRNSVAIVKKIGVENKARRETIRVSSAESKENYEDAYVDESVHDSWSRCNMKFNKYGKNIAVPKVSIFKRKELSAKKSSTSWISNLQAEKEDENEDEDDEALLDINVRLPPFWPKNSDKGDARNKVRETLRLFNAYCRKIIQGEEAKLRLKGESKAVKRIDLLAAKLVKDRGQEVNKGEQFVGSVPGVEVGDEFLYRVELTIVGIHRLFQGGIDSKKVNSKLLAVSIVASGAYDDEQESADVFIYCGQGGIVYGKNKIPGDQKLEKGNLALKNSISARNPVRVIRGWKDAKAESSDSRAKSVMTYMYDGLYTVDNYWQEIGPHGQKIFKFELRRMPGQPELSWKEVKKSNKSKTRENVCAVDISGGKEAFPVCAINTVNNEKPPNFNYITKVIYPTYCKPNSPKGCDCVGGCKDSTKCLCAAKNNGEFSYTNNGAIVDYKTLVYECGPNCNCPPSCKNRVTQHGPKIQLEIFKTKSRGWGVRSLSSIPSGGFICEYTGQLLDDAEAEKKVNNDEYLFDIGENNNEICQNLNPDSMVEDQNGGFTIDALKFGNVGRFINHSCSPNLFAQNVLYDHDDKKMPHIMFFAGENIPPLAELTYHYNYKVDQIYDLDGNIKVKRCYCGSKSCTGRLY